MEYIGILRFHYKLILTITLFGIMIFTYRTYTIHPVYSSTSSIIIKEKPGTSMIMQYGSRDRSDMSNEIEVLRSRRLAKDVVKLFWNSNRRNSLALFNTRKYYPRGEKYRRILKEIMSLGIYSPEIEEEEHYTEPYSDAIGEKFSQNVMNGISIKRRSATGVLEITFQSVFADEARRISDGIAQVYKNLEKTIGNEDATLRVEFMDDLVKQQEDKLLIAEDSLKQFKIENSFYSSDGEASSVARQISALENDIYNTRSELNMRRERISFLNSKLSAEEKNFATKISTDINAQMIVLRKEINQLESQSIQNAMIYGENHSAVIEIQKRVSIMKEKLDEKVQQLIAQGITSQDPLAERQKIISDILSLDAEIFGFLQKEQQTENLISLYQNKLLTLPDKQLKMASLMRDVNVLSQNYTMLRQKLEEAKIELASQSGRVQLLDSARRPSRPISPNHRSDILQGLIFSLAISFGIIFLIEFLDNSIRSINDIENLKMSVLGVIPAISGSTNAVVNYRAKLFGKQNQISNKNITRRLITREDPRSPISEAYRSLRTNMIYNDVDLKIKSILVSSAGPGEGKTTTVANMAITYANLGKKTLLVDTDLRRPVVHKIFDLKKEPGITNFLAGTQEDFSSLIKSTSIENLFVVTSGVIPPNPSELLGSSKMENLINELENEWDIILFDSPPLVAVTDATMVSKAIDKIIIVVKMGQTEKKAFEHTIKSLENVHAPVAGVVLNAVTKSNSYGSYYYYYQYYNYYGSDSDK